MAASVSSLHNAAERLDSWGSCAPVDGLPVLLLVQEVLPATVVGQLVEDPRALQHLTGVDLSHVKLLHDGRAVFSGFIHLTIKIPFLKDLNLILASTRQVDSPAGAETVIEAHPVLVLRVVAPG